jgi:hypothetical protein
MRTGNKEYGRYIKVLLCGDPGAGKTLLSSTFPDPFFVSAEGGMMSIAGRGLPYADVHSSEELLQLKNIFDQPKPVREQMLGTAMGSDQPIPVQTVVIDTIDQISRILIDERKTANKKDTLAIADWGWLGDQVRAIITGFRNLPMHVVFTCHLKQADDSETGRVFFKPALSGQVSDEIAGMVDLALWLKQTPMTVIEDNQSVRKIVRLLQTFQDPSHQWVKDRSGKLPQEFDVDFKTDFNRLNDLIFGDIPDETPESTEVEEPLEATDPPEIVEEPAASTDVETEVSVEPNNSAAVEPEAEPETPVVAETGTEVAEPPAGVDAETGEVTGFTCEKCGTVFDNEDQRDLCKIKRVPIMCTKCYRDNFKTK